MKKLPIGIQTFQKIREDDYVYVDKTGIAVDLIARYQYVFLSRPRRFGKSLFVDTLHSLFEGKKELFTGLVAEKSYGWSKICPVIRIDFSGGDFSTPAELRERIMVLIKKNERRLGVSGQEASPANRFDLSPGFSWKALPRRLHSHGDRFFCTQSV